MIRPFQKSLFDPYTDSDCEDGRGPKRKHARVDTSGGSMPEASQNPISETNEVNTGPSSLKNLVIACFPSI